MESSPERAETASLTEKHRVAFNKEVFGDRDGNGITPNNAQSSSKVWSQAEYGRRLLVCDPANWRTGVAREMDDDERARCSTFRRNHPEGGN